MLPGSIRIAPAEGLAQLRGLVVDKGLDVEYAPVPPPRLQPKPATSDDLRETSIWERAERVLPSEEWKGTEYDDALYWLDAAGWAYREQLLWALANRGEHLAGAESMQTLRATLFQW
jgi:hypothetical protein